MYHFNRLNIHLLHDEVANWDVEGQGAGILSFRSQRKLIPVLSNVASEGKLGNRQPAAVYGKLCNKPYLSRTSNARTVWNLKIILHWHNIHCSCYLDFQLKHPCCRFPHKLKGGMKKARIIKKRA